MKNNMSSKYREFLRRGVRFEMNHIILIEFILYFVVMIEIAYLMSRTKISNSIFLLGGKKISCWVLVFDERATGESAWLLLGFTGFVFASCLSCLWVSAGIASGIIFARFVLSRKFRKEADEHGVLTLPYY